MWIIYIVKHYFVVLLHIVCALAVVFDWPVCHIDHTVDLSRLEAEAKLLQADVDVGSAAITNVIFHDFTYLFCQFRISEAGNALGSIRLFLCLSVCFHLNRMTSDLDLLHVYGS